jgi:lipopolysaccharide biosynthesis regulator YciM
VIDISDLSGWLTVVLPLVLLALWFGYKYKVSRPSGHPGFSADYFKGLNYLLNDEQGKALDIFVRLVENNWEIVDTHFALGRIFRKNGEIDKAIKIHQGLIARPSLPDYYRSRVLLELGYDYLGAGWFDRAEGLFREVLVHEKKSLEARHNLILIYQQEKDWHKAIDIATDLYNDEPQKVGPMISQYYCELAELAKTKGDVAQLEHNAKQALRFDPGSVRASILLAEEAVNRKAYKAAISHYKNIEKQDAEFMPVVLSSLVDCYHQLDASADLLNYLDELESRHANLLLMKLHASVLDRYQGETASIEYLGEVLKKQPSLQILEELAGYKSRDRNNCEADFLSDMGKALHAMRKDKPVYVCQHCGFGANTLYWQCPSCHSWASIKPAVVTII